MRVASLYDIHGNLPALEAVLADVGRSRVDKVVVGGDVASGPLPAQTVEALLALGDRAWFVRGNADREVVEAYDAGRVDAAAESEPARRAAVFAAAALSRDQRDFLAGFSDTVTVNLEGLGETLFCHGSPRDDDEIITAATPPQRLRRILTGVRQRVVVCGH
ncbi:MAG: metallophosphoesterase family protein, partial [Solirubrobacterales bacterium]|nr:metallophosphoesterase family protein [Solirubrobacterales bacterium]